jgi:hypothetical protein
MNALQSKRASKLAYAAKFPKDADNVNDPWAYSQTNC